MWQNDIQPDGFACRVRCAAVRCFHNARSASRDDDVITSAAGLAGGRDKPSEFTRFVVVARESDPPLCKRQRLFEGGIDRVLFKLGFNPAEGFTGRASLQQPRAPKDHDRRSNAFFLLNQFGLEQFQPQPEWPQLIALQKGEVCGNVGTKGRNRIQEWILACRDVIHGAGL